jgi:hypothetical protein
MSNIGQAALIVVGTVVGAYFGSPQLGFALGAMAGSVLFPTQLPAGPQITSNRTTTATIGDPVPIIFGTCDVAGTVIWLAPLVTTTNEAGAKGGPEQLQYQYNQSIAIGLCERVDDNADPTVGAIGGISRIWENGTLVYDIRPQLGVDTEEGILTPETDADYANRLTASAAYAETFTLYLGTEEQLADPTIESIQGAGNVPAFRGLAYIVYPNRLLQTAQGWRHPSFKFEVYEYGTGLCTDQTEYSNDYMPAWEAGAGYPPAELGTFEFTIAGIDDAMWTVGTNPTGNTYSSIDDALAAANAYRPGAYNTYLGYSIGYVNSGPGPNYYPAIMSKSGGPLVVAGPAAGGAGLPDPAVVTLIYSYEEPGNTDWYFGAADTMPSPPTADGSIPNLYALPGAIWYQNAFLYWTTPYDGGTVPYPGGSFPGPSPWSNGSRFGSYYWFQTLGDLTIEVTRVPGAPANPCTGLTPSVQFPGYSTNDAGQLVKCNDWTLDSSNSYLVLQTYSANTVGGDFLDYPILYPLNPCVPLSSPNADNETFWTTAYNNAVAAGQIASGKTYAVGGSGGSDTYPQLQTHGWILDYVVCEGSGAEATVADIITAICNRVGLTSIDVSDLTGISVPGYSISDVSDAADVIAPLRTIAAFDAVESGDVLRFQTRGKPIVATLTTDQIGCYDSGSSGDNVPPSVTVTRADQTTLPRSIRLHYKAVSRDYQDSEQDSPFRLATIAVNDQDISIPICLGDQEALQAAEITWADAWSGQTTYEISIDQSLLQIEVGDCIGVPVDNIIQRMRITQEQNSGGVLRKLTCSSDDEGAYISYAVPAPIQYVPPKLRFPSPTIAYFMDLPALTDADNNGGFYVAARPDPTTGNAWTGATFFQSVDGTNFSQEVDVTQAVAAGTLNAAVPASEFVTWDDYTEIVVNVAAGTTFESRTDSAVLLGANAAAMGADGRWEIVQFANATQLSTTQWQLQRLLRGRRGTEHVCGTSQDGDDFVMLSGGGILRIVLSIMQIGAPYVYQVVSNGLPFSSGETIDFTGHGVALVPFSPVDATAELQTDGDILISWTRRDRLGQTLMSGMDIPISDYPLSFQVDICAEGTSPFTVYRTLSTGTTSVIYTAAEWSADGEGSSPAVIHVRIYQMSAAMGRGYPEIATLEVS